MECTNCNKQGHGYNFCSEAITSFGVILYNPKSKRYLMIRRKDSFGFIDFVKGKYSLSNLFHIKSSLSQMSNAEKQLIKQNINHFDRIWTSFYDKADMKKNHNYHTSSKKFEALKKGTIINGQKHTLYGLLQECESDWHETEWEFPKGRKLKGEPEIDCAIREFVEETGLSASQLDIISNVYPFEEIFIGSNHRAYKHKYFVAVLNDENSLKQSLHNFQRSEVSKIEWKTFEECMRDIRDYSTEKKDVLSHVDQMFHSFHLQ